MVTPNGSTGSSDSNSGLVLNRSIQLNTAIRGGANVPPTVNLQLTPNFLRHEIQLSKGRTNGASPGYIAELNKLTGLIIDATEYCACYTIDENAQKSQTLNGERIFQPHLYLFSILIAFEWQPSARTIQRIQVAAKKASDFLYDVTDGFMAIGQVILGSHKLLDAADIQVMASNRFHPRSWISALHEPHKFQPIRVGRGLWRKDQGFVTPWDESDSYRVLVHEWGHYALELIDEYLDLVHIKRNSDKDRLWEEKEVIKAPISKAQENVILKQANPNDLHIIAPSIALPIDTIMSTLASSELLPRHGPQSDKQRAYMREKIRKHFPRVALEKPLEGPTELPIAELPVFQRSGSEAMHEEVQLSLGDMTSLQNYILLPDDLNIKNPEILGSPWVYVLKTSAESDRNRIIIGQGIISERDWEDGFQLLGAAVGDQVVVVALIADSTTKKFQTKVICGNREQGGLTWRDATPQMPPDFIDVLPAEKRPVKEANESQLPVKLRVQIETRDPLPDPLPEVWISALGQQPTELVADPGKAPNDPGYYPDGIQRVRWISKTVELNHLDGHVLLRWYEEKNGTKKETLYICGYSHGGGPCSGGGGRCVCYTAGSYEGNSMVFFRDNYDASDSAEPLLSQAEQIDDEGLRIVSTVMHGGPQYITTDEGAIAEARSYIFSLGSNQKLTKHSATLVLYYDDNARKQDGDLLIYRWYDKLGWQRLTTYAPANQSYVCIPLDEKTSETSGGTNGRTDEYFDRYRIYWTPRR